ncbi:ribose transport system substrate-binding protein [Inquilinus ginsengisoli]|uniref:Ribose transport system substrate-binding protein n=1 Tax=Inquilinus ginsengisoli TaxID=363840 RepID=A0ABU1JQR9_9PROT|nr:substrate-binding domain-containing protein [Inquilinus ginsengisoli]MDR6290369.1 ribose transport system substrate-binding protein [Inquilinus ginsengisoli]
MRKMLLAASAAIFALAGVTPASAEETVAVIVKATTSEYWQWVFKGAEEAGRQLGVKVDKLGTPKDDAAGQIAVLESAAGTKPAAIVISPTIFEALGDPIAAVTDTGIPVVVIDSGAKTDKFAAFLTTNNEAGGKAAAEAVAACLKERTGKAAGKVGYLTAMAGHESLDSRDRGFVEGLKAYPDITLVGNRVANNEEAEGMTLTADMLTKDPDLVGLFADNAQMGTGAGAAVAEQKLGSKLCLVAFDSDAGELEHLKDGSVYALVIQDPYMMGFAGVWYGYAAAHGVRLPKNVDTGVGTVTKATMDDPKLAGLLDVSKRKLGSFLGN